MPLVELEPGLAVDPDAVEAVWQVDGRGDGGELFSVTNVAFRSGHRIKSRTAYAEVRDLLCPPPRDALDIAGRCSVCVYEHRTTCTHRDLQASG